MTDVAARVLAPPLTPALSPRLAELLQEASLLRRLVDGFGSPVNVVLPRQVLDNLGAFAGPLLRERVSHRVFMAHKANRSAALLRGVALTGWCVDVASSGELCNALAAGFRGDRLEATGPKAPDFLRLALQHGLLLNVDSLAELDQIAQLAPRLSLGARPRVVLRMSGFEQGRPAAGGRFGVPLAAADRALDRCRQLRDELELLGFSFHLSSPSPQLRLIAAGRLIQLLEEAQSWRLPVGILNVGGGFSVNLLASGEEWTCFVDSIEASLRGQADPVTWRGHSYGIRLEDGVIRGRSRLPEFFRSVTATAELEAFLAGLAPGSALAMAELLRENEIALHLEPGRAAVDKAGLTLARVASVTERDAHLHVVLEMNRSNLSSGDRELLLDPQLLPVTPGEGAASPSPVYLLGNLCLPDDLITRRLVPLPDVPRPGDVLAFPNTAGYFMDFAESETLLQRTAAKVAVDRAAGSWRWSRDELFDPLDLMAAER